MLNDQIISRLKDRIVGRVIVPSSPEYEQLKKSFGHVGAPAVIVQCQTNDDIKATIAFARDNNAVLSIRSGGHGFHGLSTNEGGVVLDLSLLKEIEVIDSVRHVVRVGAGARWGDVAKALDSQGLAISSGDTNSVGVGGLTLGGGVGWQVRNYGLTIDNIVAAELVTAKGDTIKTSETEHPDLFWAIRGGSGNFGVVTSFEFRAHPLKHILGGSVTYPVMEAQKVLKGWAEYMRGAPGALNSTLIIMPGFGPEPVPVLMILICYAIEDDDEAKAMRVVQPLLELGTVEQKDITKKPYYQMLEDVSPPPDVAPVSQTGYIKTIDDKIIDTIIRSYGKPGTPILQLRSLGGAMAEVDKDATAFGYRDYEALVWSVMLTPASMPKEEAERIRQESWFLGPLTEGGYINFMTDIGDKSLHSAYPATTYERLARVKAKYDPDNVFNQNANVPPKNKK